MVSVRLTCGLLLNYCILQMKTDNEPTISLTVCFFFTKKTTTTKKNKQTNKSTKTKRKSESFQRRESNPGPLTWKVSALPIAPRLLVNK